MNRIHNLLDAAVTLGNTAKAYFSKGDKEMTLKAIESQMRALEKADKLVIEMIGLSGPEKTSCEKCSEPAEKRFVYHSTKCDKCWESRYEGID